jgi:hypothetical protein
MSMSFTNLAIFLIIIEAKKSTIKFTKFKYTFIERERPNCHTTSCTFHFGAIDYIKQARWDKRLKFD